jgi:NAD(P)H-flavin reductase
MKPGDELDFMGPLGGFKLDLQDRNSRVKKIGLVAGG